MKIKIAVAQYYTKNINYGEYSEKINSNYCEKNQYVYHLDTDEELIKNRCNGRSFHWYKPLLIQDTFDKNPDCDYVLFLDMDAVFLNKDRRIEEFITSDFSILMTEDYGSSIVNTGVILFKNDQFSKDFLKKWWDAGEELPEFKTRHWWDQSCIELIYNRLEDKSLIKIIEPSDINSRYFDLTKFIFHAFAYGAMPRRNLDNVYYELFGIDKPKYETLLELAPSYGTDKHYEHNYFGLIYDKILSPLKYDIKTLIEIGISDGDSLLLWRDFFENANIVGVEKDMEHSMRILKNKDLSRLDLLHLDASKEENLDLIVNKYANVDVIIDDGSHKMFDQQIALAKLFKTLKPGGFYILEDLHTSYEARMPEKSWCGWGDPEKTITLDMLNNFISNGKIESDYMTDEEIEYLNNNIESVKIYQSRSDWSVTSVIIKK
jgi:SAM-dependent methyltransferase